MFEVQLCWGDCWCRVGPRYATRDDANRALDQWRTRWNFVAGDSPFRVRDMSDAAMSGRTEAGE